MINLISNTIIAASVVGAVLFLVKQYKSSKNNTEKILYVLGIIIMFIPYIIYILDRFNIPTLFKYTKDMNSERWFSFISTYVSTMVGTLFSSIILVLITKKQIDMQIDSNNNDLRIHNAPVINYTIFDGVVIPNYTFNINEEYNNHYSLYFNIENIGLNHARNISFEISGDEINEIEKRYLNKVQKFLKTNENKWICFNISYQDIEEKMKKIKIIVFYDDLLGHNYSQEIKLCIELENKSTFVIKNTVIENEKYLEKNKQDK